MRAVCHRCGADKRDFRGVCASCGHRPTGDGLLVAWLLSADHLTGPELDDAATRVRAGDQPRPSAKQIEAAKLGLGRHMAADAGMSGRQRAALLATSLVLTPLVGWTIWAWERQTRPRTAMQALFLSAPASVIWFVAVMVLFVAS